MHTFTLNFIFWTKACCYDPISCLISTLEVLRRTIDLCCRYCESSVSRTPRAINLLRILLVIWPSIPASLSSLSFSLSNLLLQIIYAIGWSPDKSQPKACRRGSASKSLKSLGEGHGDTVITRTQQERPHSPSSTPSDESIPPPLWSIRLLHSIIYLLLEQFLLLWNTIGRGTDLTMWGMDQGENENIKIRRESLYQMLHLVA